MIPTKASVTFLVKRASGSLARREPLDELDLDKRSRMEGRGFWVEVMR
jgi:hypothetical protein